MADPTELVIAADPQDDTPIAERISLRPLSYKQSVKLQKLQQKANRLSTYAQRILEDKSLSVDALEAKLEALDEKANAVDRDVDALLVKTIRHVPRECLVEDAPADLDWDDPESMEWLRQDVVLHVYAHALGVKADQNSKN